MRTYCRQCVGAFDEAEVGHMLPQSVVQQLALDHAQARSERTHRAVHEADHLSIFA